MNHEEFFGAMTNEELRIKADEIYQDLLDAADKVPQSEWHAACFAAMHMACVEMQRRKMPPPKAEGYIH